MSGVYQRNREVSEYKFFTQAIAIRVEVNKLMALLVGRAESLQAAERSPHGGDRAQHRIQRQPRRLLLPQQFVQRT